MPPYTDSLAVRGVRRSYVRLAQIGRDSLVGRGLSGLVSVTGRWGAESFTFNTRSVQSYPLDAPGQPESVTVLGRVYDRLRSLLAGGAAGRAVDSWNRWSTRSGLLTAGAWMRLIGATLLGMGCGLATRGIVSASVILAISGLVLVSWGPLLFAASSQSLVFRRLWSADGRDSALARSRETSDRSKWLITVAAALCFLSGTASGVVDDLGPVVFAGALVVVALAVAIARRAEITLLIAAAFPWVDVLVRAVLGDTGAIWDEAFLLVSVLLILWGALVTGRLQLRTVPITIPVLFVFLAATASMVMRGVPSDVGIYGLRVLMEPLLFYFTGFLLVTSKQWFRAVVGVFLTSTTALALHAGYQYLAGVETPKAWLDASETEIVTRAFSVVGKPNELGTVLAIAALVAIALLLARGTRRNLRIVLGVTALIHLAALYTTLSRSAIAGFVCGLIAMLVLAYRRFLFPTLALGAIGIAAAPRKLVDRFLLVVSESYLETAAVDGRTYRWIAALDQMGAHPFFGVGLGMYGATAATKFGYWDTWTDNTYLQIAAEGGLVLLVAFLWLMLRITKGLVKSYRVAEDSFVRATAAGMFGAMVAVAVTSVFLSPLEKLPVSVGLWLLAGATTSSALSRRTERSV